MIRDICKDELFLARKAAPASPEDLPIAQDLLETLIAHKDGCVGMAANMIGTARRRGRGRLSRHVQPGHPQKVRAV